MSTAFQNELSSLIDDAGSSFSDTAWGADARGAVATVRRARRRRQMVHGASAAGAVALVAAGSVYAPRLADPDEGAASAASGADAAVTDGLTDGVTAPTAPTAELRSNDGMALWESAQFRAQSDPLMRADAQAAFTCAGMDCEPAWVGASALVDARASVSYTEDGDAGAALEVEWRLTNITDQDILIERDSQGVFIEVEGAPVTDLQYGGTSFSVAPELPWYDRQPGARPDSENGTFVLDPGVTVSGTVAVPLEGYLAPDGERATPEYILDGNSFTVTVQASIPTDVRAYQVVLAGTEPTVFSLVDGHVNARVPGAPENLD